jgi:arylsulfatase
MLRERKQYIDGVNNLDYWTGKSRESARDNFIYYHESQLTAVRWRQWKIHFVTQENYYAPLVTQSIPLVFNLRADPYESWDEVAERSEVLQRKTWLEGPLQMILGQHIKSLIEYPPVQKATSFDATKVIEAMESQRQ